MVFINLFTLSQTEDGDIYYFNFKTGTSLWEHPMDEHYRQLYAKEKKRILESQADSGVIHLVVHSCSFH
jgi:hypothetical protein